jgi:hypothetical protein
MATLREDLDDLRRVLDELDQSAGELPHRERYLSIVYGFLRRLLDLHDELIDEVSRLPS